METPREHARANVRWHAFADQTALYAALCARTLAAAERAVAARGRFVVVLAGGNTPRGVYERLAGADARWPAWHVWFGDERCTPIGDAQRNSHMAAVAWLDRVPTPREQIHNMPAELGPVEGARRYADELLTVGMFDLVFLGLGEDGHVASLFPGHELGASADAPSVLAVFRAPKPPSERISLSARRFGDSAEVNFVVTGVNKRDAVRRWKAGEAIPAAAVAPAGGVDVYIETSSQG